jgi:hypothetical protein
VATATAAIIVLSRIFQFDFGFISSGKVVHGTYILVTAGAGVHEGGVAAARLSVDVRAVRQQQPAQ